MFRVVVLSVMSALMMSACASSKFKERQAQREKMASSAGLYCEFVSGDVYPDLDVELNMKMAQRCDANRSFSITNYKNVSDQNGVMYCCAMPSKEEPRRASAPVQQAPVQRAARPAPAVKEAPAASAQATASATTTTVNPAPKSGASEDDVLSEDAE
ncbi:hypothetical protein [Bdellovibrio sp. HCB2-146]|uniref:hypothetical protein n=1 Tax=Bdellovibrio sp. HCB2-146 TaxID=3394362 RepID=UPI0039BD44C5